jgi:hypothetical protein
MQVTRTVAGGRLLAAYDKRRARWQGGTARMKGHRDSGWHLDRVTPHGAITFGGPLAVPRSGCGMGDEDRELDRRLVRRANQRFQIGLDDTHRYRHSGVGGPADCREENGRGEDRSRAPARDHGLHRLPLLLCSSGFFSAARPSGRPRRSLCARARPPASSQLLINLLNT